MEETRKRSEPDYEDLTFYFTGKRPRTTSEMLFDDEEELMMITSEEEEDLLAVGFPIQEEMVKQVMKVLEEELRFPNNKMKTSSSYFTINSNNNNNNNEESCGPSFSDSSSTMMASMDIGSINIAYLLRFSEDCFMSSSSQQNSMILPVPSTNVDHHFIFPPGSYNSEQVSVNEVVEIINSGKQKDPEEEEGEEEEESVDEWIDRVLNFGVILEFDDDDCLV